MRDLKVISWIFALFKKSYEKFPQVKFSNFFNYFLGPIGVMKIIIVTVKFNLQIPDQYSLIKNKEVVGCPIYEYLYTPILCN